MWNDEYTYDPKSLEDAINKMEKDLPWHFCYIGGEKVLAWLKELKACRETKPNLAQIGGAE